MHIKIKKGLDIPIQGKPSGKIQELIPAGQASGKSQAKEFALNLWPFEELRLKLLKKVGEKVQIGEALCEDKAVPGRFFASPAAGTIKDVRRGLKRRLMDIIIEADEQENYFDHGKIDIAKASREEIVSYLMRGGLFANIRQRPFGILANPNLMPQSIFVKAIESAPLAPPAELQVLGHETEFQLGLDTLAKLSTGPVHLVYSHEKRCAAFADAKNVEKHTAEGPHPIGTHSVHIQHIDPIARSDAVIWTLNAHAVVSIGKLVKEGKYYNEKVVSIAGPGVLSDRKGFFRVREGTSIAALAAGRIPKEPMRLISGDPLMGSKVGLEDFLGYYDTVFCVIPENTERELLHFFRLGLNKFSFSKAYASGHLDNKGREFPFTTNQHGERRAFIDPALYDKIMPLPIPTMHLVKAVMAEDYELAEELGLLSVDAEDFALPTFVCPSKMEMTEIMKQGIRAHAAETLG